MPESKKKKSLLSATVEGDDSGVSIEVEMPDTGGGKAPDAADFTYRDIPDAEIDENPKEPKQRKNKGKEAAPAMTGNLREALPTALEGLDDITTTKDEPIAHARQPPPRSGPAGSGSRSSATAEADTKGEGKPDPFRNVLCPKSLDEFLTKLQVHEADDPKNTITPALARMYPRKIVNPLVLIKGVLVLEPSFSPSSETHVVVLLANLKVGRLIDPSRVDIQELIEKLERSPFLMVPTPEPLTECLLAETGVEADSEGGDSIEDAGDLRWAPRKMSGADLNPSLMTSMEPAAAACLSEMGIVASPAQQLSRGESGRGVENDDGIAAASGRPVLSGGKNGMGVENDTCTAVTQKRCATGEKRKKSQHNYSLLPLTHKPVLRLQDCLWLQKSLEDITEEDVAPFDECIGLVSNALTGYGASSWKSLDLFEELSVLLPVGLAVEPHMYGDSVSGCIAGLLKECLPRFYKPILPKKNAAIVLAMFVCNCHAIWHFFEIDMKRMGIASGSPGLGVFHSTTSIQLRNLFLKPRVEGWAEGIHLLTLTTMWLVNEWLLSDNKHQDWSIIQADAKLVLNTVKDLPNFFNRSKDSRSPARNRLSALFLAENMGTPVHLRAATYLTAEDATLLVQQTAGFKLVPGLGSRPPKVVRLIDGATAKASDFGSTLAEVMKNINKLLVPLEDPKVEHSKQHTTDGFACASALWRIMHLEVLTEADGEVNDGLRVMAQLVSFVLDPCTNVILSIRIKITQMASLWVWGHYVTLQGDDIGLLRKQALRKQAREYVKTDGKFLTHFLGIPYPPVDPEMMEAEAAKQEAKKARPKRRKNKKSKTVAAAEDSDGMEHEEADVEEGSVKDDTAVTGGFERGTKGHPIVTKKHGTKGDAIVANEDQDVNISHESACIEPSMTRLPGEHSTPTPTPNAPSSPTERDHISLRDQHIIEQLIRIQDRTLRQEIEQQLEELEQLQDSALAQESEDNLAIGQAIQEKLERVQVQMERLKLNNAQATAYLSDLRLNHERDSQNASTQRRPRQAAERDSTTATTAAAMSALDEIPLEKLVPFLPARFPPSAFGHQPITPEMSKEEIKEVLESMSAEELQAMVEKALASGEFPGYEAGRGQGGGGFCCVM
ncbi:uncharacterized protein L3040_008763 [Drepanopeziza brunnea f. sp. 'multigermtubi']|uniref:Uncharacterized protein n=1 Tax=Marssonina brunnea f. sp. multigermtubi (strain MB_m1) TaxID=1072389 RepID=K1X0N9_MARBU|nr:uncharacterized protein MBM_02973 [Drepanopeziza brunnea f. sp. 'multigermtubi' MB_m1]EKD18731.1 hypothetical protein MBM_02973 [Drepanopeziza brunnea f. sp. 'multigermtubi' MB_m1]KAJ5033651.1 hypothetical protein L3040_008763 [Drepanopeziza brunnea f. sp. 'multigermtubi']